MFSELRGANPTGRARRAGHIGVLFLLTVALPSPVSATELPTLFGESGQFIEVTPLKSAPDGPSTT